VLFSNSYVTVSGIRLFERIINNFNISYSFFGFTFNRLVGNESVLTLLEIGIFGREILSINPVYISSNVMINSILPQNNFFF
jgi:hypothetical protein